MGPHWSSSLERQLLNFILASRSKSSAHIFYTLDMIAPANDLHQSYILHTDCAFDSNEDDQCGPTFPLFILSFPKTPPILLKMCRLFLVWISMNIPRTILRWNWKKLRTKEQLALFSQKVLRTWKMLKLQKPKNISS